MVHRVFQFNFYFRPVKSFQLKFAELVVPLKRDQKNAITRKLTP